MCGISGMFAPNGDASLNKVKKMNEKIAHRGPDNSSYYSNEFIAFGHRRLSIIDLDKRSNQPMTYRDMIITFNGEIYNYKKVRKILIKEGYKFSTDGDCEVILKAYHKWGVDCVEYFKGMWAFAIYDEKKDILFCSRDRFGIKPFYYTVQNSKFYFGSEIKQLCGSNPRPVLDNILDFIIAGYVDHNERTFFEGIFQLLPGNNLIIQKDEFKITETSYFNLNDDSNSKESRNITELLNESISEHLISDVKVGSCLSGGLDSSYLNSKISETIPSISAIHANSTDKNSSEKKQAEQVAKHLDINLEVIEPTLSEFMSDIETLFYVQEHPFGDPSIYMQYRVMKKAKLLGIKVMLDGQGADEVFMGYPKYLGLRLWKELLSLKINSFFNLFLKTMKNNSISLFQFIGFFIGTRYERIKHILYLIQSKMVLKYWFDFIMRAKGYKSSKAFQFYEIYKYPLQTLLRNEDRNSMWFSIEARVPYLDHKLVSAIYNLSIDQKVSEGWTKNPLRIAAKNKIPKEIIYRKDKIGFNSPPSWLSKISYSEIFQSKILNNIFGSSLTKNYVNKLNEKMKWRLLSVAIWERVFNIDDQY